MSNIEAGYRVRAIGHSLEILSRRVHRIMGAGIGEFYRMVARVYEEKEGTRAEPEDVRRTVVRNLYEARNNGATWNMSPAEYLRLQRGDSEDDGYAIDLREAGSRRDGVPEEEED